MYAKTYIHDQVIIYLECCFNIYYYFQVGQAKADAQEVKKQIDKAVNELDAIKEELITLKDINTDDLDKLGIFLSKLTFIQFE